MVEPEFELSGAIDSPHLTYKVEMIQVLTPFNVLVGKVDK